MEGALFSKQLRQLVGGVLSHHQKHKLKLTDYFFCANAKKFKINI